MTYYDTSYPPSLWEAPPAVPATGATAGIPGTWTPPGSVPPPTFVALATGGIVANPSTPWTGGQFVQTADPGPPGRGTWTGTDWVSGVAPMEEPQAMGVEETMTNTPTEPVVPEPPDTPPDDDDNDETA